MADTNTDLRCYLTNAGIAAENNSIQLDRSLKVVEMVFGSGLLPDASDPRQQTAMIQEEHSVPCGMLFDEESPTLLVFKGDLPADVGGFHINEVAIRLEDGTIYGYARGKGDYKPTLEQGSTDSVRYVVEMYTTNADRVECKVDLSSVYVDWEDLEIVRVEAANALADHVAHDNPHPQYPLASIIQDLVYDPNRTYKQNESCITFNAQTGAMERWISYAPSDNKGHDPQEPANRHEAWPNFPTPCWWIKAHGLEPGTPTYWLSNDIPENAMQVMDLDIDAAFYHRIAKAHPSLVADGKINLAALLGRYIRIADGVSYLVNATHEDAIRNIEASMVSNGSDGYLHAGSPVSDEKNDANITGAFSYTHAGPQDIDIGTNQGENASINLHFNASNVVPTADQNQPVTTMQNYIIWM